MDLVRPAVLKQISLRLSAEGERALYLALDHSSGKIFSLPKRVAQSIHRMKHAATSADPGRRLAARAAMDEDSAKEAYGFLHLVQSMRNAERLQKKPFNPVFASFPLLDVGPWQASLQRLSQWLVSYRILAFLGLLLIGAFILGTRNDWAIVGAFNNVFSLEALLTFGLIAPVLKVIHEFGHVLAATRFGVRVRKGGLFIIGMYPMPFVDCSEADISAGRKQRIIISAAGIVTDVLIGLMAFIAWHFTEGSYLHTLLGNIFVFSTLNSILFNANPLIKLDGYYVLTDAIGRRNLYTRASSVFSEMRCWITSFGREGQFPIGWRHWGLLTYAVLALIYRINILWVIASGLLPRYLGVGAIVAAWGATVLFVIPALRENPQSANTDGQRVRSKWFWRLGFVAAVVCALFLVKLPFKTVIPVTVDQTGAYQITIRSPGFTQAPLPYAAFDQAETLYHLQNPIFTEQFEVLTQQMAAAELVYSAVQGEDPAKALAARKQVESLSAQQDIMLNQFQELQQDVSGAGVFLPTRNITMGSWLEAGEAIGVFLPSTGAARLSGAFPERYVTLFREGVESLTLRSVYGYTELAQDQATIREVLQFNRETGTRSWQLDLVDTNRPAAEFAGQPVDLKITFARAPIWRHLQFRARELLAKFRESQLVDRRSFLD